MMEPKRCERLLDGPYGCDFYQGHAGACSDAQARAAHEAAILDEIRALEAKLCQLRGEQRPRNRKERRARR